ncbi:MAG: DUF305 domain-containing protein [Angelakisella sp.]
MTDTNVILSNVTQKYLAQYDTILQDMIDDMKSGLKASAPSRSISLYFIETMIPHHKAAIEMCENLLQYTTDLRLQHMANNIIRTQNKGIQEMKEIEERCEQYTSNPVAIDTYVKNYLLIANEMFIKMKNAPRLNNINCNFILEMIPHHEGAVKMSKNVMQYPICGELRIIVDDIIKEQSRGIVELQNLKRFYGCAGNLDKVLRIY